MQDAYDVVIVGAGPAGLAAAKACIEGGVDTLLIEEHAVIGEPVQCGEVFTRAVAADLGIELDGYELRGVELHSPSGRRLDIVFPPGVRSPLFVTERKMFEKRLAVHLSNMGCHIRTKTTAVGLIEERTVVKGIRVSHLGCEQAIGSKIVIGADGPMARVGRWAGLNVYRDLDKFGSVAQYQVCTPNLPARPIVHVENTTPPHIGYILPKGNGLASVGYGILGSDSVVARELLDRFMARYVGPCSIIETNIGVVPIGGAADEIVGDGLMLIGDAARQVNPLTGAGIRFAVRAGILAGNAAAEAIEAGRFDSVFLSRYEKGWRAEFDKFFKRLIKVRDTLFGLSNVELDKLFDQIGDELVLPKGFEFDNRVPWYSVLRTLFPHFVKSPRLSLKLLRGAHR